MTVPLRSVACPACGHRAAPGGLSCAVCGARLEPVQLAVAAARDAPPYVRRPELEAALAERIRERPGLQLVGDAGCGKTRLVEQVVSGSRPPTVSCADPRPRVRDLLADLLDQLDDVPLGLVRLLRGAAGAEPGEASEVDLLLAAGQALAAAPLVVVDDAERLPEAERLLLAQVVATGTSTWLLATRERLSEVALEPLDVPEMSEPEAAELLDALLPQATSQLREAVLGRAGHHPLYLVQCARLLLESGTVAVAAGGTLVVSPEKLRLIPRSMRLFVSSRLDLLDPEERRVIGVAAVLGDHPEPALLGHLTGHADDALQSLVERGLLRWSDLAHGQRELRFSHALVRDVAYEGLSLADRSTIHRAAAEWYALLPVSQVLESQAYHLEAAVGLGEPDCDLLRRTVEAMVLFARSVEEERTRISHEVLTRARALVDARPECDVDTLLLDLSTSSVLHLRGEEVRAQELARQVAARAEAQGLPAVRAEALLLSARSAALANPDEVEVLLDRAEASFAELSDLSGQARVAIERGMAAQHGSGIQQQLAHLASAYELSMRSGDSRLQATTAQQLALHHAISNGRTDFETWADRARQVSRRDDLGLEGRLDLSEACLAMFGLDAPSGLEAARRAHLTGRELGLSHIYRNALVARLELLVMDGNLAEAEQLLTECHEAAASRPNTWLRRMFDLSEARLRTRRGDPGRARALLEGVGGDPLSEHLVLRRDLAETRGWVAMETGRFEEARDQARTAVLIDVESEERAPALRARFVYLVAGCALRENSPLADVATLKADARTSGLGTVAELVSRWMLVEELTHGWSVSTYGLTPTDVVEAKALDLEIAALSDRRWDLLVDAAQTWEALGHTIWRARALIWHTELTGTQHDDVPELLRALDAPTDIASRLAAQVTGLRD